MDTSALKSFAQEARRYLLDIVSKKIDFYLTTDSVEVRARQSAVNELKEAINKTSKERVIEQVAYTWFNRFCALRYMDVNQFSPVGILSPLNGETQPEILKEAKSGHINPDFCDEKTKAKIIDLLSGKIPSPDPQTEAYRNLITLTCNYYNSIMPFLFDRIDHFAELLLPDDLLSENSILSSVRNAINAENCTNVEVIGWLYQFYISEKKDEVFEALKKNKKITPENIPAATQLFTPNWIVRYLVENSLGRLWMLNRPSSKVIEKMEYYIKPEEEEKDFLKIKSVEEIRICDPACGSGHMLVYAFELFYMMYEEEGYASNEIPEKILTNNLFGIEIDNRAGELAAFALIMKAREKHRRFLSNPIQPNICVLKHFKFEERELKDYIDFVGRDLFTSPLLETLGQFEEADNFGSLIRPALVDVDGVLKHIESKNVTGQLFLGITHQRVVDALTQAKYLGSRYHVVIANPPYMGSKGMNEGLRDFLLEFFPLSKADLMTAFMERSKDFVVSHGFWGMINLPSWMFLSSYEELRKMLLRKNTIISLSHFGRGIFGSDFGSVGFIFQNLPSCENTKCTFRRLFVKHVDVRSVEEIKKLYLDRGFGSFKYFQKDFYSIEGCPIAYWVSPMLRASFTSGRTIESLAPVRQGFQTGNNEKFLRYWYEVSYSEIGFKFSTTDDFHRSHKKYAPYNKGGAFRKWFGNNDYVVKFDKHNYELLSNSGNNLPSRQLYFNESITWSSTTAGRFGARFNGKGFTFSAKGACAFPVSPQSAVESLSILNSKVCDKILEFYGATVDYNVGSIRKIPIPATIPSDDFIKLESNFRKCIEIAKADWDSVEWSFDYKYNDLIKIRAANTSRISLKDVVNQLLNKGMSNVAAIKKAEEENNKILAKAYGLEDEIEPVVFENEISLFCNYLFSKDVSCDENTEKATYIIQIIKEYISYAISCILGRCSLDKEGLILADQGEAIKDYLKQVPNPTFSPDIDNVIPILEDDWFTDDIASLFKKFLKVTFGEEHFDENLKFIEDAIGKDIRKYFAKDFYNDHVKMYKKRPIYWMFSSPKGSFNALIYMHRYTPETVSIVLNDYLREFRTKLNSKKENLERIGMSSDSARDKTAALKEIEKIKKIIVELEEYEHDTLYPLATKKIQIDLDDGVKVNYLKFGDALKPIKGLDKEEDG